MAYIKEKKETDFIQIKQRIISKFSDKRRELGLSHADMARLTGMHVTIFGKLETGKSKVSLEYFILIGNALGLSNDEMLFFRDTDAVQDTVEPKVHCTTSDSLDDRIKAIEWQIEILMDTIKELSSGKN